MGGMSNRFAALEGAIDKMREYELDEAIGIAKSLATAKFDESMDLAVVLGIDPKKSDQMVRGALVLPHGTGRQVRVAVFAEGDAAEAAKAAGAEIVGYEDLAQQVKDGFLGFDIAIATPQAMRLVGQLGPILGPKGLMPNPKVGTVSQDVALAVRNAKAGQVQFRADKGGVVHVPVGRASFSKEALRENILALLSALEKARPQAQKGTYIKKVTLSPTMGPGIRVVMGSAKRAA